MGEKEFKTMFDRLKDYIGRFVQIYYYYGGFTYSNAGILNEVVDFDSVTIEGIKYPLIGHGKAVRTIKLYTGEMLYENKYVDNYYNGIEEVDVVGAIRTAFGSKYADMEQARIDEMNQITKERNEETRRNKLKFIQEGLELVQPDKVDDWLIYADVHTNYWYSSILIGTLIDVMKKLDENVPFEEIDKLVYKLDGNQAYDAIGAIIYFAKAGSEYRNYCKNKRGEDFVKSLKPINVERISV